MTDPKKLAALALVVLGFAALWWAFTPDTEVAAEQERAEVLQRIDRPDHGHDHEEHTHLEARQRPPTQPSDPLAREEQVRRPPLNSSDAWKQERAKAAASLHQQQVEAAEQWARGQGLSPEDVVQVATLIDTHHASLREWKQELETGDRSHADLRSDITQLRKDTQEGLQDLLGFERMQALRIELRSQLGGGF